VTDEGRHWVKQTYNSETDKVEKQELPVGEKLVFDPNEFLEGSEVYLFKQQPIKLATDEDGNPLSFEDFLKAIEEKYPGPYKFKPGVFYNRAGDILEAHWKDGPYIGNYLGNGIDLFLKCKETEDEPEEIVGCMIWGIKKRLLREEWTHGETVDEE